MTECLPCKVGILLGISKYVCESNLAEDGKKECDELYDQVVAGKIGTLEFIDKVRQKVTDASDLEMLDALKATLPTEMKP